MDNRNLGPCPWQPLRFNTGKKKLLLAAVVLILSLLLVNSFLYAGVNLGFTVWYSLLLWVCVFYLLRSNRKLTGYSGALLLLSQVLILGFARSDDMPVKAVIVGFVIVGVNLSFSIMAGHSRENTGSIRSLLDAAKVFFTQGFRMPESFRGIAAAFQAGGKTIKNTLSVLGGLCIAVPVLVVLILLLSQADAAFQGILNLLPAFDGNQLLITLVFGFGAACYFYTRAVALRHNAPQAPQTVAEPLQMRPITVNTVLICVCVVYAAYLVSQLAYFLGGFSGILPEGFTMAQYARRGFFEMAWLCVLNLGLMVGAISLVKKDNSRLTRGLCLFIGLMTLLLVTTASAKMLLYIDSFGLTRLRVLTEVIIVFLGLTTLFVSIWLLAPKLPYMRCILLTALLLGGVVIWADVDTVVARYNVTAYQEGKLETVDIAYLSRLSAGARPYLVKLAEDPDPAVAKTARYHLAQSEQEYYRDLRGWNWAEYTARDRD